MVSPGRFSACISNGRSPSISNGRGASIQADEASPMPASRAGEGGVVGVGCPRSMADHMRQEKRVRRRI